MTKRELNDLYYINKEIKILNDEIQSLESASQSCTQRLSHTGFGGSTDNKIERYVAEIVERKQLLELSKKKLEIKRSMIERFLDGIEDGKHRLIMRLKYINGMTLLQISQEVGLSLDHSNRLHQEAIKKYCKHAEF